jgi:hypothetical protein
MQQSIVKFYYFVVRTLLNMFRALLCPSSGARQTAVAAFGFLMDVEVEVFSAVVSLLVKLVLLFYLSDRRCTEPQTLNPKKIKYRFRQ